MEDGVALLRLTDSAGEQLVLCCVPKNGSSIVCIGEEESWLESCRPVTGVVVDTTGAVQITDPNEISAVAAWLAAAAVWLRARKYEEGFGDGIPE